jgi:hypothetical protein
VPASIAIMPGESERRTATWNLRAVLPTALYVIGALVFFRWQIFSNFDLVFGELADTNDVAFLHEHIYRWLWGRADFLSPPFFFNLTETLGYSDAFLLDEIVYVPLRLLGADPLLAITLTAIVLSAVGYVFAYLLLRRSDVSVPVASLAALIFTFPNNLYLESFHPQCFAVYYIPIIAYCGLLAVSELHQRPVRAYLLGAFAAGLYGVLFSTAYYIAWFFGLGVLIFTAIAGYVAWPRLRTWWRQHPPRMFGLLLVAALGFTAALSVFVIIYAPVLATGAKRSFAEYLDDAPQPIDIINVGTNNVIWSGLIRSLHLIRDDRLANPEISIALTPVVEVLLLASAVLAIRSRLWPASDIGRISRAFVIAGASVCALFYLLAIKIDDVSLFHLLYAIVPGANAIRVGYRGMIVANLFAAIAIGLTLDRLIQSSWSEPLPLMRSRRLFALIALASIAAIEQVNLKQASEISRKLERQHLSAVGRAPRECRSFYVAARRARVQEDAMRIAQAQHLPTINGDSGLYPPDWDLDKPYRAGYEGRAIYWAVRRGIVEGLCRLDVGTGTWTVVDVDRDWNCTPGGCLRRISRISFGETHVFEINLAEAGNWGLFADNHWAGPEVWGQWTDATQAGLSFSVGTPRDLVVALSVRPLLSAIAPKQSVWVEANQCRVGGADFDLAHGSGPKTISGDIPAACINADGTVILRVNTDRVRSPKEIGMNDDERKLGVAVERVHIKQDNLRATNLR